MTTSEALLSDLLTTTKDGDWGSDVPVSDHSLYYVIRGTDFSASREGRIAGVPKRYLADSTVHRRTLQENDILLETAGGSRDRPTGRTLLVTRSLLAQFDAPVTCASFARFLRPNPKMVDPAYLFWYLQSIYASGETFQYQVQHTGVARFQYTTFANSKQIPLPPLPTQHAIAEVLGALDDKIAANRILASAVEQRAGALLEASGMLDEPDGRPALTLTELVELNPKLSSPAEDEPVYVDMQKLPTSGMSIRDWGNRSARGGARFQNGDTLLARITPCLENRKTGFVDFLADGDVALGSTEYIVMRARDGLPAVTSFFIATSDRFRAVAIQRMQGTSGRQRVAAADLAEYELSRPNEERFAEFAAIADSSAELIASLRDEDRGLAALRDTLLPQLMSGKLRVKDAEQQVEAVV